MKPIEFKEATEVIAKNQPPYIPFPVHRESNVQLGIDASQSKITACWQLNWKERIKVMLTGKVWHQVLTFNKPLQPQLLLIDKPKML